MWSDGSRGEADRDDRLQKTRTMEGQGVRTTITNSTRLAFSNAQNSLKSGAGSTPLPPEKLYRGDSLFGGAGEPGGQHARVV